MTTEDNNFGPKALVAVKDLENVTLKLRTARNMWDKMTSLQRENIIAIFNVKCKGEFKNASTTICGRPPIPSISSSYITTATYWRDLKYFDVIYEKLGCFYTVSGSLITYRSNEVEMAKETLAGRASRDKDRLPWHIKRDLAPIPKTDGA